MLEAVSLFIICLITHVLDCYIFGKLVGEKFKLNLKNVIIILLVSIFDYFVAIIIPNKFKYITANIVTFILLKIIYNKSFAKTIMGTIFTYFGYVFADIIFAVIFILILGLNPNMFITNIYALIFVNIFDFIVYFGIFNIKIIIKSIQKLINWYEEKKILNLIFISILIIIMCYVILYPFALNEQFFNYQFLILCIFLGIMVFVIGFFKEKSNNNQLTIKYDNLLDFAKDYEKEVVEKGKVIHEHKNQLAVIDGMIPSCNKKLKKYVGEQLEKVSKLDDNVWLEKLTNLPEGGTKGLVYLKIKKMLDNKLSIYVDIDNELKNKNKWNNVNKNLEEYTRILGVYLDNAIEASIDSKDKQIIIEFIDNRDNIEFILSNTYKGKINFEEIDKGKFSTKGKGRGYGLAIVKEIIDKNIYIKQSKEINGKFYVQKLYIKK